MKPYTRWTRAQQPYELMCIECGAIRPTLHLPVLQTDAITCTLGPLILPAMIRAADDARVAETVREDPHQ